ncbi:MAG TPA: iron-sulfur cluster assembly protein, partial [Gemmatimonadales bacterium]
MPSASTLAQRVHTALAALQNPRTGQDIVAAGMVRDLVVDDAGAVSFTFALTRDDPATLAREARRAVQAVPGVTGVRINVMDPSAAGRASGARGAAPAGSGPGVPPPPTPV